MCSELFCIILLHASILSTGAQDVDHLPVGGRVSAGALQSCVWWSAHAAALKRTKSL